CRRCSRTSPDVRQSRLRRRTRPSPRSRSRAPPDGAAPPRMGPPSDARMPLTAHLEELRWRITRALAAVGVAFGVSYWFADPLFAFLFRPLASLRPDATLLIGTGVTE